MPFILILIMIVIIFGFSATGGSVSYGCSETVAKFIKKVMTFGGDKNYSVSTIDMVIRKLAHFFEYLVLTILLFIGFSNIARSKGASFFISAVIAVLVSLIDEGVIQTVSGRNSSLFDVMLDCTGIVAGLIVFLLVLNISVRMKAKK